MSRYLPFVFVLFVALEVQAAAPVARLTAPETSCVAPCALFFDARGSTDADLSEKWEEYVDLSYVWDFGDPDSGTWLYGASQHSKNVDTGYVAGHVYEVPGTYDVVLSVSDGPQTSNATVRVTIRDPNAEWPGSQTVCISNDSNHGGCPSGARQVSNVSDFDAALRDSDMCNIDSDAVRCLFRRGDEFSANDDLSIRNGGPSMVGA